MTNQLSKRTRGRLYARQLESGGRVPFDAFISHALDVEDRLKTLLKVTEDRDEKCITIASIYAILQK